MTAKPATVSELHDKAEAIVEQTPAIEHGYAPNVVVALLRVMRDLPSIGKDQTASAQQGGYPYRGIEQITQHTQRLFAQHGVLFGMPRVVRWEIRDLMVNNKPWMDVIQEVEYDVYGPGGIEDRITVGPILCIGRDNSDKGGNKGLTQAYKYALIQALSIADKKDDADGQTHEADTPEPPMVWDAKMTQFELRNALKGNKEDARKAWEWASGDDLTEWSAEVAHDIAKRWMERPIEGPAEPALPLGDET